MKFDLNCDLGEHEPLTKTRRLMRRITSANVACGGHACNVRRMEACVRLAKQFNVRLGAHPGLASNFGRGAISIGATELEKLLIEQVHALRNIARSHSVRLHHIKLHGSLYHATDQNKSLATAYLDTVQRFWPRAKIYARAGGLTAQLAHARGVRIWEEVFADRRYRDDGTLVPRDQPHALVTRLADVVEFLSKLKLDGEIVSIFGKSIPVRAQTICIHSDTPGATRIASACRRFLDGA